MSKLNLIPYIGGKYFLAPWIVSHFPEHRTYIEVFGGALNVFLTKTPARVEILNDLNSDLYNLWCVIQSDGDRLQAEADKLPYARKLYSEWATDWHHGIRPADPFQRALHFYYISRSSYSGKQHQKTGWSHSTQKNQAKCFRSAVANLSHIQHRLQAAQLENINYDRILASYDREDALFYLDPPYYRKECYTVPFTETDHQNLAIFLRNIKGKAAVSYYPHPQILQWYPEGEGWFHHHRTVPKYSQAITGTRRNKCRPRERVTEILITNYPPPPTESFKEQENESSG